MEFPAEIEVGDTKAVARKENDVEREPEQGEKKFNDVAHDVGYGVGIAGDLTGLSSGSAWLRRFGYNLINRPPIANYFNIIYTCPDPDFFRGPL